MLVSELGGVNWLWAFMVNGQIYGISNFGHNFCQLALLENLCLLPQALERCLKSPKKVTTPQASCGISWGLLIWHPSHLVDMVQ